MNKSMPQVPHGYSLRFGDKISNIQRESSKWEAK
jgi:hypothetical protein